MGERKNPNNSTKDSIQPSRTMSSTSKHNSSPLPIPSLILTHPPPLNPAWLSHIPHLPPPPPSSSPQARKSTYRQNCVSQNALLLDTSLSYLAQNLRISTSSIPSPAGHQIPTRLYTPTKLSSSTSTSSSNSEPGPETTPLIIYFHGGGLYVGDLDTEDLTCRALFLSLHLPLLSISYRLLPDFSADDAVSDALVSFSHLCTTFPDRKFILVGSSSGGQLATTIALTYLQTPREGNGGDKGDDDVGNEDEGNRGDRNRILGVILRCPVTCDATDGGISIPSEWKNIHTSMKEEFHTSILSTPAVTKENRVREHRMPLEILAGMPKVEGSSKVSNTHTENLLKTKWFLQLCTNDIYYSDGVCLGLGLRDRGYDVKIRVEVGWPHTYWLKGMILEEARMAERKLVEGAAWVLRGEDDVGKDYRREAGDHGELDWVEWSKDV